MSNPMLQLLVLAGIAVFLILRLRSILGTREGFEKPREPEARPEPVQRRKLEVVEGGLDTDIADHADPDSATGRALAAMKRAEPSFSVSDFLKGARGAYEMILMSFEKGDIDGVRPFLAAPVAEAFDGVIDARKARNLTTTAEFAGLREMAIQSAGFDPATGSAEITMRFVGELISATHDESGVLIGGDTKTPRKQRDLWTFERRMGANDPNWELVATGG